MSNEATKSTNYDLGTFSGRLMWAMDKSEIGAEALADLIGVTRAVIYQWKDKPATNVKAENALRAADALGVSVHWLVLGTGEPNKTQPVVSNTTDLVLFVAGFIEALEKFTISSRMTTQEKADTALQLYLSSRSHILPEPEAIARAAVNSLLTQAK